jgi:hypothetical protein
LMPGGKFADSKEQPCFTHAAIVTLERLKRNNLNKRSNL